MHVLQLFHFFLLAPQIEIVEATLPEPTAEFTRNRQPAGGPPLRFAQGWDFPNANIMNSCLSS